MDNAINITGGKLDKDTLENLAGSIVKILDACLNHRDSQVTITALNALSQSLDTSFSDLNF